LRSAPPSSKQKLEESAFVPFDFPPMEISVFFRAVLNNPNSLPPKFAEPELRISMSFEPFGLRLSTGQLLFQRFFSKTPYLGEHFLASWNSSFRTISTIPSTGSRESPPHFP